VTLSLENVTARIDGADVIGVSLRHERGVLAVVGSPADGASALLAIAAGSARARGTIARPEHVAHVPLQPLLPEGLRGREVIELAADVRREAARADERLAAFGIESLAERDTRALSPPEARALLACEALTSEKVGLACIAEPLAFMASAAVLRMMRAAKMPVIASTASPDDARSFADRFAILRRGRLVSVATTLDPFTMLGPNGARLVVITSGARALAAHIEDREIRMTIEADRLVLEGPDPHALAKAAQHAIATGTTVEKVRVEQVRIEALALEPLQAAATAQATATYEAALARARAAAQPPIPMPAPEPKP